MENTADSTSNEVTTSNNGATSSTAAYPDICIIACPVVVAVKSEDELQ